MKTKLYEKMLKYAVIVLPLVLLFYLSSCIDDGGGNQPQGTVSEEISNDQGGSVSHGGYTVSMLPNSLMQTEANQNPSVTLSIEVGAETPTYIPSAYQLVGQVVKYGPEGFVFNYPMLLYFPAENVNDYENLVVLYFDESEEDWVEIQICEMLTEPNRVGISTLKLGVFALAKKTNLRSNLNLNYGGVKIGRFSHGHVHYSLTVKEFIPKYQMSPSEIARVIGTNVMSGWGPTSYFPARNPVTMTLPLGQYYIWVSKLEVNTGKWITYSNPCYVNVDNPLVRVFQGWTDNRSTAFDGWYDLEGCQSGGSWVEYRPGELPAASETVGTGKFQATLTWVNSENSRADIDLHMYGPNDVHIYWANKSETGFAFELDYDWLQELGNAVENIYSISDNFASGHYKISVLHYSGDLPKRYNVRIINNGVVKNFSGTLNEAKEEIILYEFNY